MRILSTHSVAVLCAMLRYSVKLKNQHLADSCESLQISTTAEPETQMFKLLKDIKEFALAVINRWAVLVTGGIVVGAIAVYEHASGKSIAGRALWIVISLSIFSAVFIAWRNQRDYSLSLKSQLEEMAKLKLSIDPSESRVSIEQCGSGEAGKIFCISIILKVQFENHTSGLRTVREVSASLHYRLKKGGDKEVNTTKRKSLVHSSNKQMVDMINGIPVEAGGITPSYWFLITLQLPVGNEQNLDEYKFLRLSLTATGQPQTFIEAKVDWDEAFDGNTPLLLGQESVE